MLRNIVPANFVDDRLNHNGYLVMNGAWHSEQPYWHRHNGIEIVYAHSGTADIYTRTRHSTLHPGELSITQANHAHGTIGSFNRTVLCFVPDLISTAGSETLHSLLDAQDGARIAVHPESAPRLMWAAHELQALLAHRGNAAVVQALFGLIISDIAASLELPAGEASSDLLPSVIEYMRTHVESDETIDSLANRFHVSRSSLHHLFQSQYGYSPRQYWLKLKLDSACRLLQSERPIKEIAATVGFQSLRGFQQAFQRAFRMSATQYRECVCGGDRRISLPQMN